MDKAIGPGFHVCCQHEFPMHEYHALCLTSNFGDVHACRCNQLQAASAGCTTCTCAVTNTCTRLSLADPSCKGCQAYPVEFCNDFHSNRIIIGIIVSRICTICNPCLPSHQLSTEQVLQQHLRFCDFGSFEPSSLPHLIGDDPMNSDGEMGMIQ